MNTLFFNYFHNGRHSLTYSMDHIAEEVLNVLLYTRIVNRFVAGILEQMLYSIHPYLSIYQCNIFNGFLNVLDVVVLYDVGLYGGTCLPGIRGRCLASPWAMI